MTRLLSVAAALAASAILLTPVAGHAQAPAGYYTATPVAVPAKTMLITGETIWHWQDTVYTANRGPQRPSIVCEMVVKRAGKLSAFTAGGQPLDGAALDKCNARAK